MDKLEGRVARMGVLGHCLPSNIENWNVYLVTLLSHAAAGCIPRVAEVKRIVADMGKFMGQRRWLKDDEVAVIKVAVGLKQGPDHPLARIIAWYVGAALRIYGHRALQPGGHGRAAGCYEICSSDILRESGFDLSKAEEMAREGPLNSKMFREITWMVCRAVNKALYEKARPGLEKQAKRYCGEYWKDWLEALQAAGLPMRVKLRAARVMFGGMPDRHWKAPEGYVESRCACCGKRADEVDRQGGAWCKEHLPACWHDTSQFRLGAIMRHVRRRPDGTMANRKEGHCPLCACPLLCAGHLPRCPGVRRVAEVLGEIREQRSDPITAHPDGGGDAGGNRVEPLDMVKAMAVASVMLMGYTAPPAPLQ